MKYDIEKNNHPDWLNKGQWYNKAICSKQYVTVFKFSIRNDRTDRYNIISSITENDE